MTLFYVPVKENNGPIAETINLIRLKDKVGTRQLPTAELFLDGTMGYKVYWISLFLDLFDFLT